MPKVPKIVVSLRAVFIITVWYFQQEEPEISK
jgi:hypothetical protein